MLTHEEEVLVQSEGAHSGGCKFTVGNGPLVPPCTGRIPLLQAHRVARLCEAAGIPTFPGVPETSLAL